jgi:hypothetical protein
MYQQQQDPHFTDEQEEYYFSTSKETSLMIAGPILIALVIGSVLVLSYNYLIK